MTCYIIFYIVIDELWTRDLYLERKFISNNDRIRMFLSSIRIK